MPDHVLSLQEQLHYAQNAAAVFLQWLQQGNKNDLTTWLLQGHFQGVDTVSDH